MTEEQAIAELNDMGDGSEDEQHNRADMILIELLRDNGFKEVSEAWLKVRERLGFWYA